MVFVNRYSRVKVSAVVAVVGVVNTKYDQAHDCWLYEKITKNYDEDMSGFITCFYCIRTVLLLIEVVIVSEGNFMMNDYRQ